MDEFDFWTVGAFQIITAKLDCIFKNGSQVGSRAVCIEDAMYDSLTAINASLQRMRQLLPLRIVAKQLRTFPDRLKHIVQIVDQPLERKIGNCHSIYSATRCSVSKNSGKDTEAASAPSTRHGPSAARAATENAMA